MFRGSRDFNILTCVLLFVGVITLSGFRTNISFWTGASIYFPTGLSLTHSANNKTFSVSWTAGSGNGGASGCRVEFQRGSDSAWVSLGTVNCDVSGASVGVISLPGDGWNGGVAWTSRAVRLLRISDSAVVGNLGNVTCSSKSNAGSSTPSIDENCNNVWDDSATVVVTPAVNYSCTQYCHPYEDQVWSLANCAGSVVTTQTYSGGCCRDTAADAEVCAGSSITTSFSCPFPNMPNFFGGNSVARRYLSGVYSTTGTCSTSAVYGTVYN